jgi:hypothetical protein
MEEKRPDALEVAAQTDQKGTKKETGTSHSVILGFCETFSYLTALPKKDSDVKKRQR